MSNEDATAKLVAALAPTRWIDPCHVAETGSTNADLVAAVRSGRTRPTALIAAHQTAGRGRLARRWQSPPGANLLLSVVVAPSGRPDEWGRATTALAIAAADTVRAHGVEATLKWPNDLVVGELKLAGLLAEAVASAERVVVGVGLNVAWPTERTELGTSLAAEGVRLDPVDVAIDLLRRADSVLDWPGAQLRDVHRDRCSTLGRQVRVELVGGGEIVGAAVDLDDDGALVVDLGNERRTVTVGDVHHLRPA